METTGGTLLGGRVSYRQFRAGYRTGIEPVLLAAAVPAREGERVLEAGCGAGAGLLCLLSRVPGLLAVGVERDGAMAALARANVAANGWAARIETGAVAAVRGEADHVFANPPWHDPAGTPPADSMRAGALHRDGPGLAGWIGPLAAILAPGGSLTLVLPAALLAEAAALLARSGLGAVVQCPLLPKAGRPAKLALLRGVRGSEPSRVAPGLVLHRDEGGYTEAAEAILRHGAGLRF